MENELSSENAPSGIHKIHVCDINTDGILVKFGGAIDIASCNISKNNKTYGIIQFKELKEKLNIGDTIPEEYKTIGLIVEFIFDNSISIDILINHLNHIKNELNK